MKLDGMSGQPDWTYTVPGSVEPAQAQLTPRCAGWRLWRGQTRCRGGGRGGVTVSRTRSATGAQKFSVPMQTGVANNALYDAIVAGDGYAYVAYGYADGSRTIHLMLLRVNGAGASNQMDVDDFPDIYPGGENTTINQIAVNMITNADQGVLISWVVDRLYEEAGTYQYDAVPRVRQRPLWGPMDVTVDVDGFVSVGMAVSNGTSVTAVNPPTIPGQGSHVVPMVQLQDGSFVGVIGLNSQGGYYIGPALQAACVGYPGVTCPDGVQRDMIAFDASGNVKWVVPNEVPEIATDDGGVIGQSGTTYDASGSATRMMTLPTYSWQGYAYQDGPATRLVGTPPAFVAATFWAFLQGNVSGNRAAQKPWFVGLIDCQSPNPECQTHGWTSVTGGPNEWIFNGLKSLLTLLATQCNPTGDSWAIQACNLDNYVFTSNLKDANGNSGTRADFAAYLKGTSTLNSQYPSLYDGARSYLRQCGWTTTNCSDNLTQHDDFTGPYPDNAATIIFDARQSPKIPRMRTFFRSGHIFPELLGIAEPNNMATIFHEALHAYTRLPDKPTLTSGPSLKGALGCDMNPGLGTYDITAYLKQFTNQYLPNPVKACTAFAFITPPDDPV